MKNTLYAAWSHAHGTIGMYEETSDAEAEFSRPDVEPDHSSDWWKYRRFRPVAPGTDPRTRE